jgi:hypothetical protein
MSTILVGMNAGAKTAANLRVTREVVPHIRQPVGASSMCRNGGLGPEQTVMAVEINILRS